MANAQNVAMPGGGAQSSAMTREERKVIIASSLGTVFEWYDFYLYGSLAAIIAKQFFSGLDPTSAFIFALLAFAAGFIVRPFGALVFGRLGDMIGRKYTFLVTILIMGVSTFIVGLLPGYATIGWAAPIILIALRMLQGLALGGEYGGAATYVAEHAPHGKRGSYTSWIQTTATLGLFLSLIVILICRELTGPNFEVWGWRIPFLLSILLLGISVYIRLSMNESPAFQKMKSEGKTSKAPLTESFGQWRNLKIVILALVGLTAGQAVVWYTGQFYALFFLTQVLKVDAKTANLLIAGALVLGTPFFIFFGMLSDKIGRKWIIMAGCALAVLTYFPLFKALTHYANPALERAQQTAQITVTADPRECSFQGSPIAREVDFRSSCDIAKRTLAQASASYEVVEAPPRHRGYGSHRRQGNLVAERQAGESAYLRRRQQGADRGVQEGGVRLDGGGRLSHQGGPGANEHGDGAGHPGDPGAVRDHGLRTDRRHAGRDVPHAHPLHLDVAALPYRQRLVRRPAAHHLLRAGGAERQHLLRSLVPDRDRRHDVHHRLAVHPRDQGRGHLRPRLSVTQAAGLRASGAGTSRQPQGSPAFLLAPHRTGRACPVLARRC